MKISEMFEKQVAVMHTSPMSFYCLVHCKLKRDPSVDEMVMIAVIYPMTKKSKKHFLDRYTFIGFGKGAFPEFEYINLDK